MASSAVKRITLYRLAIPLRRKVWHAASQRVVADPVVVGLELTNGVTGYGETLPRPYVTGESVESVVQAVRDGFASRLLELHPRSFAEAVEAADALPFLDERGVLVPAARAAVELAMLDAYSRFFDRSILDIGGWAGLGGFGPPGSAKHVRYSGVIASENRRSVRRTMRQLWWFGLRHFKLKVGDPDDTARLQWAARYLRRPIRRGTASLRVDVNGAWTKGQSIIRLADWCDVPLAAIEQPLPKGAERDLPVLRELTDAPIMHDESLVTMQDAERLRQMGVADAFNIRISKCGGLLPALKLAAFARRHGILIQLGCMVGETSILSAAGWRFIQMTPAVRFAEGCFGSFLLRDDVVRSPLRFGYGGRGPTLGPRGLGVDVDPARLARLCLDQPITIEF